MESPCQDEVFLHTLRLVPSLDGKNVSLEPEQEDLEKETRPESRGGPLTLTRIEFRIQQLNSRCLLLQEIQRCRRKEERNSEDDLQRGVSVVSPDKQIGAPLFSI